MSTRERFGTIVFEALHTLNGDGVMGGYYCYRTPAQIAEIGQVSIPTARKYLRELVAMGQARAMRWGRVTVYGPTKDQYDTDNGYGLIKG